jgi:hypothetical protein
MTWLNYTSKLKQKDLVPIPWMVAMALQADGWYLRSDIIWSKPNPMPESVTDRPTKAHEYIFLLTKSARYYYDAAAINETAISDGPRGGNLLNDTAKGPNGGNERWKGERALDWAQIGRNKRSVWHVATQPYPDAHFATYPEALIEPCILAGSSEKGQCAACGKPWMRVVEYTPAEPGPLCPKQAAGYGAVSGVRGPGWRDRQQAMSRTTGWQPSCGCDAGDPIPQTVLDPFCGSGTTGVVAIRHQRHFIGCELNPEYMKLAEKRLGDVSPLFADRTDRAVEASDLQQPLFLESESV